MILKRSLSNTVNDNYIYENLIIRAVNIDEMKLTKRSKRHSSLLINMIELIFQFEYSVTFVIQIKTWFHDHGTSVLREN